LIFNKNLTQWPTDPDRTADFAQVSMKVRKPEEPVDRFTIQVDAIKSGGVIKFTWDETEAYAPFEVLQQ